LYGHVMIDAYESSKDKVRKLISKVEDM